MNYPDYPNFQLVITNINDSLWTPLDIWLTFSRKIVMSIHNKSIVKQLIFKESTPIIMLLSIMEYCIHAGHLDLALIGWFKFFTTRLSHDITMKPLRDQLKSGQVWFKNRNDNQGHRYNIFFAPSPQIDDLIGTCKLKTDEISIIIQPSKVIRLCVLCHRVHDDYLPICDLSPMKTFGWTVTHYVLYLFSLTN